MVQVFCTPCVVQIQTMSIFHLIFYFDTAHWTQQQFLRETCCTSKQNYTHLFKMSQAALVDFSIFAKLWKSSDTGITRMGGKDPLYVPHTIIFMDGIPMTWYFTSLVDGRYKRRSKKKLITDEIFEHFKKISRKRARNRTRNSGLAGGSSSPRKNKSNKNKQNNKNNNNDTISPSDSFEDRDRNRREERDRLKERKEKEDRKVRKERIQTKEDTNTVLAAEQVVAVWISNVMIAGKTSRVDSKYMNLIELKHFLFGQHKGYGAGMLQQVIHMHGNTRRALRCHWSPHISTVEMCVNKWTITNSKIHINVRMSDVNAGRGNTVVTRLDQSTKLGTRIRSLSDTLAARVEEIANTSRDGRLLFDPSKMNHPYEKAMPVAMDLTIPSQKVRRKGERNDLENDDENQNDLVKRRKQDENETNETNGNAIGIENENENTNENGNENNNDQEKETVAEYRGLYQNSLQRAYLDPFLRNATFKEKRNLLGVRLHSATFNFTIGEDNRTYLVFCNDVQMVDSQPAHQKRKKRSNAHTLEIEMLETANKNQSIQSKKIYKPKPSPILQQMGLGLLPTPEENFYRSYKDSNYKPEPDANDETDALAGTGFSVREMLQDGAEMLRAFFRRYSHHKTGALNLRAVFSSLDTSGDGLISSVEFRDLFREVNIHLTRTQLFQVIRLFDEDCDGRVSIEEFENWIMKEPEKNPDDHLSRALARENKMSPWGQKINKKESFRDRNRIPVDSVLFKRMRVVDEHTASNLLNEEHAQASKMMAQRSAELAKSFEEANKHIVKTEAEKRTEMLAPKPGDITQKLAKEGEHLPKSIERAYGKYRIAYMETVVIPLRGYTCSPTKKTKKDVVQKRTPRKPVTEKIVTPSPRHFRSSKLGQKSTIKKSQKIYNAKYKNLNLY